MNLCDCCFQAEIGFCGFSELLLNVDVPDGAYVVSITDKFDHVYQESVVKIAGEPITIDLDVYPQGLFNPFAGVFVLKLHAEGEHDDTVMSIVIDSDGTIAKHTCIEISVVQNIEKNEIGWPLL